MWGNVAIKLFNHHDKSCMQTLDRDIFSSLKCVCQLGYKVNVMPSHPIKRSNFIKHNLDKRRGRRKEFPYFSFLILCSSIITPISLSTQTINQIGRRLIMWIRLKYYRQWKRNGTKSARSARKLLLLCEVSEKMALYGANLKIFMWQMRDKHGAPPV